MNLIIIRGMSDLQRYPLHLKLINNLEDNVAFLASKVSLSTTFNINKYNSHLIRQRLWGNLLEPLKLWRVTWKYVYIPFNNSSIFIDLKTDLCYTRPGSSGSDEVQGNVLFLHWKDILEVTPSSIFHLFHNFSISLFK